MKDKFIRFLKDHHSFDEYKKEISPLRIGDLDNELSDGGACFLLQGVYLFL